MALHIDWISLYKVSYIIKRVRVLQKTLLWHNSSLFEGPLKRRKNRIRLHSDRIIDIVLPLHL